MSFDDLAAALRPHYRRFLAPREGAVLLTGHSHQAWPDVSREAHLEAWDDAARLVDQKWGRVFGEIAPRLKARIAPRLGTARPSDLVFAPNTHEFVVRLLSCFGPTPTLVTTTGEFHSLHRQLMAAELGGARVRRISATADDLVPRLVAALDGADLLLVSMVFFETARVLDELPALLAAAALRRVPVLVDAYHAYNVVPIAADAAPGDVFWVAGGYKYAAAGEGACFLLVPETAERFVPLDTGWFSDFAHLDHAGGGLTYGPGGDRFAGATFDPTALYRAERVLRFFDEQGLTVERLRAHSLAQTSHLLASYDARGLAARGLGLATPREPARRGGFVSFVHPRAAELSRALAERGIFTDARGPHLRLGPSPLTTTADLDRALDAIAGLLAAR